MFDTELGAPHPGAVQRRRGPVVVGAGGARLRVGRHRRRDRRPLRAGRAGPVVADLGRPAAGARSVPIARLHADRSVDLLPDGRAVRPATSSSSTSPRRRGGGDSPPGAAECRRLVQRPHRRGRRFRDRLRAPEQRLLRFTTVLVLLAVVSSPCTSSLTAGLMPLDAVSYAITLLTGAALPIDLGADAPRRRAGLRDLPEPRRGGRSSPSSTPSSPTRSSAPGCSRRSAGAPSRGGIHDHVVVAGLGAIGYRVALGVQARGMPVVVVERRTTVASWRRPGPPGIPVVIGDARHREVLDEVRIGTGPGARVRHLRRPGQPVDGAQRPGQSAPTCGSSSGCSTRSSPCASSAGSGSASRAPCRSLPRRPSPRRRPAREVVATVPVGDRRMALFARLRVPAGSALEGQPGAGRSTEPGARRLLAVADPGSERRPLGRPARRGARRRRGGRPRRDPGRPGRAAAPRGAAPAGALGPSPTCRRDRGRAPSLPIDPTAAVRAVRHGAGQGRRQSSAAAPAVARRSADRRGSGRPEESTP